MGEEKDLANEAAATAAAIDAANKGETVPVAPVEPEPVITEDKRNVINADSPVLVDGTKKKLKQKDVAIVSHDDSFEKF